MKKLLLFTFALLALNLTFTSCSKDDDVDTPDSLVGTAWVVTLDDEDDGPYTMTLSFTTATDLVITYSNDDEPDNGTYVYEKPEVMITSIGNGIEISFSGTVNGNKMTLTFAGVSITLTRK
ncbi:MAG: hypothetical protein LBJ63_09225 [Prevotellaceae bacterium]|jgi:hypothetical protein|nr:hypothetical protein [Prevotellaceae bacterium]